MALNDQIRDRIYDRLISIYGNPANLSSQDLLERYFIAQGYPDGYPGNDALISFYTNLGAVGSPNLGDIEYDFWNRLGPNPMVDMGAVFTIDAANHDGSQLIKNRGTGGSALDATSGSTSGTDTNDPLFLPWVGKNYVFAVGGGVTVPPGAALNITGDIEMAARGAVPTTSPGRIMSKGYAGCWGLGFSNTLVYSMYDLGAGETFPGGKAHGKSPGTIIWLRCTRVAATGAVNYYIAPDQPTYPTVWTSIGTPLFTATGNIVPNGFNLNVASGGNSGNEVVDQTYNIVVKDGIDGITVLDIDFTKNTSQTSFVCTTGQTVTIGKAATGRKTVMVTRPMWLFGVDDYMTVPDNALLNFGANQDFSLVAITRRWGVTAVNAPIMSKGRYGDPTAGWDLVDNNAGTQKQGYFGSAAGADFYYSNGYSPAAGSLSCLTMTRSGSTIVTYGGNTVIGTNASGGSLAADLTNTNLLYIGRDTPAGTGFDDTELLAVGVFRRALTPTEVATLVSAYGTV
jgi:hypothetical protein